MRALEVIELEDYKDQKILVVGRGVIALKTAYDPDQLWLDLGDIILFPQEPEPKAKPERKPPHRKTPYAKVPDICRPIYVYEPGVPQYVLPFREFRSVSNKDWKRLQTAHYPGWQRYRPDDGEHHLLTVPIHVRHADLRPLDWCYDNCRGRFFVKPSFIVFEREIDYMLGKMMFS